MFVVSYFCHSTVFGWADLNRIFSNWDFSMFFSIMSPKYSSPALHINLPSLFSWPFLTSRSSTSPYPTLDPSLPPRDQLYNKFNEFFGKALHFHWEHQLLLSFEWKDGKAKMGRTWVGENEGAIHGGSLRLLHIQLRALTKPGKVRCRSLNERCQAEMKGGKG